jgi:hypothetical protein
MMQAELPPAPAVRRALDEVYALPEFAPRSLPGPLQWLADRWGEARAWLAEMLERLGVQDAAAPLLFWGMIALLGVAALVILAHFAGVGRGAWRARERRGRAADAGAGTTLPRGAAEWEAEARRAAAEGRLRDAALALYQALLLRLDARGDVRYDPAKTPGDYRLETRAKPEAARVLDAFLRAFEPVAFGGRPIDGAGYDALRRIAAGGGTGG